MLCPVGCLPQPVPGKSLRRHPRHPPHANRSDRVKRCTSSAPTQCPDPARPWAGVSPLQHAADTGSLSGWLDKRLSEEASGPVGSFLPVAKYDADPDADLGAADPLAALRRDIGAAKGQTLLVESQMSVADSPASARSGGRSDAFSGEDSL